MVCVSLLNGSLKPNTWNVRFEMYKLKGTPSSIVIDKDGILRYNFFGSEGYLEGAVMELMQNR